MSGFVDPADPGGESPRDAGRRALAMPVATGTVPGSAAGVSTFGRANTLTGMHSFAIAPAPPVTAATDTDWLTLLGAVGASSVLAALITAISLYIQARRNQAHSERAEDRARKHALDLAWRERNHARRESAYVGLIANVATVINLVNHLRGSLSSPITKEPVAIDLSLLGYNRETYAANVAVAVAFASGPVNELLTSFTSEFSSFIDKERAIEMLESNLYQYETARFDADLIKRTYEHRMNSWRELGLMRATINTVGQQLVALIREELATS